MSRTERRSLAEIERADVLDLALDAIESGMRAEERVHVPVAEWAARHMRTERGELLDFAAYPHMVQPMNDRAQEKGLMCGSQVGKTTVALADAYHFCDTYQVRVIFTMHTQLAVRDFSRTRAKPAIEASPYLSARMRGVDSTEVKVFVHPDGGRSVIFFRGAQTDAAAISEPADMLVHDEIDRSRPDVLSLYRSRTAASEWARRIITSTPTIPKFGIAAHWEDSSQTQWLVRCPVCGDERPLTWPDSVATDAEVPCYICARGHELTREIIRAGRWVDGRTGNYTWRMYHFNRMLMPNWPAERIVAAERGQEYQDYPELFYNEVLGLPKASGDLAVNEEVLAKVMVGFPPVARSEEPTFAGCDQSPRPDNHRVLIGTIDAEGAHSYIHLEVCGWDRLAELMHLFNIQRLVIDAMPETSKARELAAQFPNRVYLAWYAAQPLKGADRENIVLDRREHKVNLDRTATLDHSARRLELQQDFFCAMPADLRRLFVTEMTNMVRGTEVDEHGQPRSFWQNTGPDHWRHAHNYATVAGHLFARWSGGPKVTSLEIGPGLPREVEDPQTGRKLTVRPGHIPVPEGVVGPGTPVEWRRR